ncbi:AHL acylase [Xylariaceae sp. FL0255]|nr:AHL acylase [Xylariaceae sp. FL0255]
MSAVPNPTFVETSYGRLAIRSAGPSNSALPPILAIHGNSSTGEIFRPIFESSSIISTRRVIALDLPGHGESEDAKDPNTAYTMPGYAKAAVEVLTKLGISEAVILGWSLGGHIGVEMLPLLGGSARGLVMVGSLLVGLYPQALDDERTRWNLRQDHSAEELAGFARMGTGGPFEEWMAAAAIRTDKRARRVLFENLGFGDCSDQQRLAAETKVPTMVVVGSDEPHLDNNLIKGLPYGNLWSGQVVDIPGGQHCPLWEKPELFVPILEKFLDEVAQ